MAAQDLERFRQLLRTFEHKKAMPLFDALAADEANFWPVADAVLLACANHQDPKLTVPHGLQTVEAAHELFSLAGPQASRGLLRFVTLYSFSLVKRDWTAADLGQQARAVAGDPGPQLWKAITAHDPDRAAAFACALAVKEGIDAAGHALIRAGLADFGRLHHHATLAVSYAEAARRLGMPDALVPLANGAHFLATSMQSSRPFEPEAFEEPPPDTPSGPESLEGALLEGDYDAVHAILHRQASPEDRERAFGPLLVGVAKDPGFLGHNLLLAHAARRAARYLTRDEVVRVLWKLYRTLGHAYGYPSALRVQRTADADPEAAIAGLRAMLERRETPPLAALRPCFVAGVPFERVVRAIVASYPSWRVGEKEHTILFLSAAVQTAKVLGPEKALLPLTVALQQLPF